MKTSRQENILGHDQWHERQQKISTMQAISHAVRRALETSFPDATEATLHHLTAFLADKIHLSRFLNLMQQPATEKTILKMRQELCRELRRIAFAREMAKSPNIRSATGLPTRQLKQAVTLALVQFSETEASVSSDIQLEIETAGITPVHEFMEQYPLIFVRF